MPNETVATVTPEWVADVQRTALKILKDGQELSPMGFLLAPDLYGKDYVTIVELTGHDRRLWRIVVRSFVEKLQATAFAFVSCGWRATLPKDGQVPRGGVKAMPGRQDIAILILHRKGVPSQTWTLEYRLGEDKIPIDIKDWVADPSDLAFKDNNFDGLWGTP